MYEQELIESYFHSEFLTYHDIRTLMNLVRRSYYEVMTDLDGDLSEHTAVEMSQELRHLKDIEDKLDPILLALITEERTKVVKTEVVATAKANEE
tara:strand:- start:217 stop:501 length:285 start_codon:yes stop_codon:yes gene_type:complete